MRAGCGTRLGDGRYASVIEDDDGPARLTVASADGQVAFVLVIPEFSGTDWDPLAQALNLLDARFVLASEMEKESS